MDYLDLIIHDTVHNYNGSTKGLADSLQMTATILNNKACPTNEHHHFRPSQLTNLQKQTNDWSITDYFIAERDKHKSHNNTGKCVTQSLFDIAGEFGRMAEKVNDAMADGILTDRERVECLKEAEEMLKKCEQLKASLHAQEVGKIRAV